MDKNILMVEQPGDEQDIKGVLEEIDAFSIHERYVKTSQFLQVPDNEFQFQLKKNNTSQPLALTIQQLNKKLTQKMGSRKESIEEANYDRIELIQGKKIRDRTYYEKSDNAEILIDLLRLREDYCFDYHQNYEKVENYVRYDPDTGEPTIVWNVKVDPLEIQHNANVQLNEGIYLVSIDGKNLVNIPPIFTFMKDLLTLLQAINNNSVASFCYNRLKYLEQKYKLNQIFNQQYESIDQKQIKSKDLYNVFKVDTHIHHSAAMSAKHLLEFMKKKWVQEPDTTVSVVNGKKIKLKEIFQQIGMERHELSLNALDVQADKGIYKRFDRFNNKYNPLGQASLREIFLKTDNYLKGRYLAELTKELIDILEEKQFVGSEWRISIYGKSMMEWHKLGKWIVKYKLYSSRVRWMIQIPRLYAVYKKSGLINNFQEMIDNLFRPLFDITINPTLDPFLYQALFQISGFDTVDDESIYEHFQISLLKTSPKEWTKDRNPPYTYWIYYIYTNLYTLNALRKSRGLNTFQFRPHCGEAGDLDHLATAFLTADGINHGIELNKSPVLTYLYYLKQIGLAVSPVSNNKLFCKYQNSPFRKFFEIGLNVTLSTDDPLILHLTSEPLIEEYSIASQIFDLSNLDLAEIARNSVRQSGFEQIIKEYWAGKDYWDRINSKNTEKINNIPNSRFMYRKNTLNEEYEFLESLIDIKI